MNCKRVIGVLLAIVLAVLIARPIGYAQSTQSTGSIQGTVTDPQGAVVPDAKITVTSKGTGQATPVPISSSGTYNTGQLNPGTYVAARGSAGLPDRAGDRRTCRSAWLPRTT